jgi:ATP-dependent Lon protease
MPKLKDKLKKEAKRVVHHAELAFTAGVGAIEKDNDSRHEANAAKHAAQVAVAQAEQEKAVAEAARVKAEAEKAAAEAEAKRVKAEAEAAARKAAEEEVARRAQSAMLRAQIEMLQAQLKNLTNQGAAPISVAAPAVPAQGYVVSPEATAAASASLAPPPAYTPADSANEEPEDTQPKESVGVKKN